MGAALVIFLEGSMGDNPQKRVYFAYYGLKTHA